ncbi:ASCH domain-containing protein [Dyadobacter bucti]|uniref:ASCH domain-containing protein n=1 Tax=Dyadobacter bucti TaxID=2572203 RepID=UPI003F7040B0
MLFKQKHLERILTGQSTVAFRKWKKPAVVKGSLIRTSIGVVNITDIIEMDVEDLSEADAVNAGFDDLSSLRTELGKIKEGILYKISVKYYAADERIGLREKISLDDDAFAALAAKLGRLDKSGEWTLTVLNLIRDNPELRAADLAAMTGREKEWLKLNIRKLKNLGLTISLETGYRISPLGTFVLDKINRT